MTIRRVLTSCAMGAAMALITMPATADPATETDVAESEDDEEEEVFGEEWVWVDAGAGYQYVDLVTFDAEDELLTAGLIPTKAGGPVTDFGVGARLWFLTLGPRLRIGMFDAERNQAFDRFTLWSLDGELGLRLPLGRLEPHLTLAAGYTGLGGLDDIIDEIDDYSIHGANIRGGAGLDVFIVPMLSLGADVSGEALILSRSSVSLNELAEAQNVGTVSEAEARVLEADGTSTGASVTVTGKLGLHF